MVNAIQDYLAGFRDIQKDRFGQMVTAVSYEVTGATVDSQAIA